MASVSLERQPSYLTSDCEELTSEVASEGAAKHPNKSQRSQARYHLSVKSTTWPHDGRGLLHSNSPAIYLKDFKARNISERYIISRSQCDVSLLPVSLREADFAGEATGRQPLVQLSLSDHNYCVERISNNAITESKQRIGDMWEVVTASAVDIGVGEIIRFGSYKVRLVDIALTENDLKARNNDLLAMSSFGKFNEPVDRRSSSLEDVPPQGFLSPTSVVETIDGDLLSPKFHVSEINGDDSKSAKSSNDEEPACRICFDQATETNPLIVPCKCKGSVRYIHSECLHKWIDGQLQIRKNENGGGTYHLRSVACELCRTSYERTVYNSLLIHRPTVPHIVLEEIMSSAVTRNSGQNATDSSSTRVHVMPISLTRPVTIGRSKENDVNINDISISRVHAQIRMKRDIRGEIQLVIEDRKSKFGTLVALPQIVKRSTGCPLTVQVGVNTLLNILVSESSPLERFIPDRLLSPSGVVRITKHKVPSEKILEKELERRRRAVINRPTSSSLQLPAGSSSSPPAQGSSDDPVQTDIQVREILASLILEDLQLPDDAIISAIVDQTLHVGELPAEDGHEVERNVCNDNQVQSILSRYPPPSHSYAPS